MIEKEVVKTYEERCELSFSRYSNLPKKDLDNEYIRLCDLLNELKNYLKVKYNKPGEAWLGLVHRLDRPVGGVCVFAKTSKAASRLSEQIRNKSFSKIYYAVLFSYLT